MASILITGANSGLGFETAFQLASKHANATIILGCRSLEKADQAAKDLRKRLGEDNKTKFVSFAVDVSDIEVSKKSATELLERKSEFGGKLTHLVLNAGLLTNSLERTKQGYELMVAASLFGHHVIVSKWLEAGLIADDASIVISGSEATTNVFPATAIGFSVPDFHKLAKERGFSLEELLTDLAKNSINEKQFVQEPQYAFAKCYVSWWSSSLARRYPSLTVTTVSPGMTPNTAIARSAPWYLTLVIMFVNWVGVFLGIAHDVATGSKRYIDGLEMDHKESGSFFASPPHWMAGKLEKQHIPHLEDEVLQEAAYKALVGITGSG